MGNLQVDQKSPFSHQFQLDQYGIYCQCAVCCHVGQELNSMQCV